MTQHPIHALLTPDPAEAALPIGFTSARVLLTHSLPVPLDAPGLGLTLLLSVPTARIRTWIEAEANLTVADAVPQCEDVPEIPPDDDARKAAAPVLIITRGRVPIAVMPLIVNARTLLPRAGGKAGAALELVLRSFLVTAEAMRGPGAGASFVELAWRRIDAGTDAFMAPVVRSALRRRLVATTGTGFKKQRRAVAVELYTETGTDPASAQKGGINWRLTHD